VAALDLLHRLRREHDSPLWLNVAAVIHGTNLDELPRLARWVADRGYGNLLLQPIVPPFWSNHDRDWLRRSPLWPHDPAHVAAVLDELIALRRDGHPIDNDEAQLRGMKHYFADGPLPRSADDTETAEASGEARPPALPRGAGRLRELTDDDATPLPPIDPARLPAGVHPTDRADRCLIGHKVLNINPRGEVRLCHDMPPVGNLRHQTLRQIWTSPRAAELRDHIARCHEPCYLLNCNWCD
jgi:MoaA/NifB/PqqE/SkfB family radical SAM enzyme